MPGEQPSTEPSPFYPLPTPLHWPASISGVRLKHETKTTLTKTHYWDSKKRTRLKPPRGKRRIKTGTDCSFQKGRCSRRSHSIKGKPNLKPPEKIEQILQMTKTKQNKQERDFQVRQIWTGRPSMDGCEVEMLSWYSTSWTWKSDSLQNIVFVIFPHHYQAHTSLIPWLCYS